MKNSLRNALLYTTLGTFLTACGPKPQANSDLEAKLSDEEIAAQVEQSEIVRYNNLITDSYNLLDQNRIPSEDTSNLANNIIQVSINAQEARALGEELNLPPNPGLDELWVNLFFYTGHMDRLYSQLNLMLSERTYGTQLDGANFDKKDFAQRWAKNLDGIIENSEALSPTQYADAIRSRTYLSGFTGGSYEN